MSDENLLSSDNDEVGDKVNDSEDSDESIPNEHKSKDSDSDYEISDEEETQEPTDEIYCLDKDDTQGRKTPSTTPETRPPGELDQAAKNAKTKLDCWNLFITEDILTLLVQNTNQCIKIVTKKFQRLRDCRPTDLIETKALLGLLYLAGVFRRGHQSVMDLWATDSLGIDIFRMTVSSKRFTFLLRCMSFDDKQTREDRRKTDKLAAVRELFTIFVDNCKNHFYLSQNVTIGEMLAGFQGRCEFVQHLELKPSKHGIKIFGMSDSKSYYTANLEIYCGVQPEGPFHKSNSPDSVLMRLAEPIFGSGRNITADKWFTSLDLVRKLRKKNITYVGPVRKSKTEFPIPTISPKKRPSYSSIFGFSENETILSYLPKKGKAVVLLSSMHVPSDKVLEYSNNLEETPEIISFFNDTKSAVDNVDKLCNTYNVARSTKRWPIAIFYHLLNIAGINSHVIFEANNTEPISRREYLKKLSLDLLEDQLIRRSQQASLPFEIKNMLLRHKPEGRKLEIVISESGTKRKRCQECYQESRKTSLTLHFCERCGIPLCLKRHSQFICRSCLDVIDAIPLSE